MNRYAGLLFALIGVLAACGSGDPEPLVREDSSVDAADYSYTIPAGSGEALDRGEPLEILPQTLEVRVGEVFEMVNEDDRGHLVGPFFVGAGETLRQRFNAPGQFIGACTVHPSGEFVLTVIE
ncbi:MAG: hypothetical protein QNJ77_11265 [Acidimicrobiia bacterium]|nr:hypothetical protein [Acidimicrobiia bacterium]